MTARYSHRRLYDLAGAVEKLPTLVPTPIETLEIPLRITGTDGLMGIASDPVPDAVNGGIERHSDARIYTADVPRFN